MHAKDWLLVFISFFLPPLTVFIKRGLTADFWINVLLFILGFFPGLIHALYIISQYPEDERRSHQGITLPGQTSSYGSL